MRAPLPVGPRSPTARALRRGAARVLRRWVPAAVGLALLGCDPITLLGNECRSRLECEGAALCVNERCVAQCRLDSECGDAGPTAVCQFNRCVVPVVVFDRGVGGDAGPALGGDASPDPGPDGGSRDAGPEGGPTDGGALDFSADAAPADAAPDGASSDLGPGDADLDSGASDLATPDLATPDLAPSSDLGDVGTGDLGAADAIGVDVIDPRLDQGPPG